MVENTDLKECQYLANSIHKKFNFNNQEWVVGDNISLVLSQISNMIANLVPKKSIHDADCAILSPLSNGRLYDGVCNCGFGLELMRVGVGENCMFSKEVVEMLEELN